MWKQKAGASEALELRLRGDGYYQQILPQLRQQTAGNVGLHLRSERYCQQILPGVRQKKGGLSHEAI